MVRDEQDIPVLITRPLNEAQDIMSALVQRGFRSILNPLLEILPVDCGSLILKDAQALVATSLNGVRRLSQLTPCRHLPLYVTGDTSAREAQQAGFEKICKAQGSVESLVQLMRENLDPAGKKIFYISGQEIRGDLAQTLIYEGYPVERVVAYKALAVQTLKPETREALITRRLQAALFFSPRTSEIFVTLTKVYAQAFESMVAVCMSTEISRPLKACSWKQILISQEKTGRSMVEALEKYYKN